MQKLHGSMALDRHGQMLMGTKVVEFGHHTSRILRGVVRWGDASTFLTWRETNCGDRRVIDRRPAPDHRTFEVRGDDA